MRREREIVLTAACSVALEVHCRDCDCRAVILVPVAAYADSVAEAQRSSVAWQQDHALRCPLGD